MSEFPEIYSDRSVQELTDQTLIKDLTRVSHVYGVKPVLDGLEYASRFPRELKDQLGADISKMTHSNRQIGLVTLPVTQSGVAWRTEVTPDEQAVLEDAPIYRQVRGPWNNQPNDYRIYDIFLNQRLALVALQRDGDDIATIKPARR